MQLSFDVDRRRWDAAMAETPSALQQDWSYGDALAALGADLHRVAVMDGDNTLALAQVTARKIGFVANLAVCLRGPVWLEPADAAARREAMRAIKRGLKLGWPRATLFSPDDEDAPKGMARVMTGYSTVMLELDQELDALRKGFDGKWRNRLVAAEKAELKIAQNGTKLAQYRWLLETEEGQRKARGYRATPAMLVPQFIEAKGDRDALLILRADQGREKLAAMMFLIHGSAATYHIGWNSDAGRKLGAHNLILWRALEMLKARGVRRLDLGGVETVRSAGLARFKIGTGGRVVTYCGTFF